MVNDRRRCALLCLLMMFINTALAEQSVVGQVNPNQPKVEADPVLAAQDIEIRKVSQSKLLPPTWAQSDASPIDGRGNNIAKPEWGRADVSFTRLAANDYADGLSRLAGSNRPSARLISNRVNIVSAEPQKGVAVSDMFWQWGQFIDHDITLSPELSPEDRADIPVPIGDSTFDSARSGTKVLHFNRSTFALDRFGARQQKNAITAYIDASHVYGSDIQRQRDLRRNDGTGRLRVSAGNLLPFNTAGLPNAPTNSARFFIAGDFRANEQVGLTALHTVFVREHNRIAVDIGARQPDWSDDQRYEYARAIVSALMQHITYNEFLPKLLGRSALAEYAGYNPKVNVNITNEFATAAFRVGHTMLSSQLLRVDIAGKPAPEGHLRLRDAFFRPDLLQRHGIESILRGLCQQRAQKVDLEIVDDVRNLLFNNLGEGLDLASLNIQRGRDHGLASYADTRNALGLSAKNSFSEISPSKAVQSRLSAAYSTPNNMDLWVGGLAEPAVNGAMVGETFFAILRDQFQRLRDGDRYWYQNVLPQDLQRWVETQTLSSVIQRNSSISSELPRFAMNVPEGAPLGTILPLLLDD